MRLAAQTETDSTAWIAIGWVALVFAVHLAFWQPPPSVAGPVYWFKAKL